MEMPLFLRIMKCLSRKECLRTQFPITLKKADDGDAPPNMQVYFYPTLNPISVQIQEELMGMDA